MQVEELKEQLLAEAALSPGKLVEFSCGELPCVLETTQCSMAVSVLNHVDVWMCGCVGRIDL